MRIDYPIQITPELIDSLHHAVKEPSGSEFAFLLSMLSVLPTTPMGGGEELPAQIEGSQPEVEYTVNGAAFLTTIQQSQTFLRQ